MVSQRGARPKDLSCELNPRRNRIVR